MKSILYCSQKSPKASEEIDSIIQKSLTYNKSRDITGYLYSSESYFIQYLEGEQQEIDLLYGKIAQDRRHRIIEFWINPWVVDKREFGWFDYIDADKNSEAYKKLSPEQKKQIRFFEDLVQAKLNIQLVQNTSYRA